MKKLFVPSLLLAAMTVFAQQTDNPFVPVEEPQEEPADLAPAPPGDPVPVDASVWVLLTAGVGLAAYYGWRKTSAAK